MRPQKLFFKLLGHPVYTRMKYAQVIFFKSPLIRKKKKENKVSKESIHSGGNRRKDWMALEI